MKLPWTTVVADQSVQDNMAFLADNLPDGLIQLAGNVFIGTGSPNGVVTASPPALYLNRSGGAGTTLYVKESGVATNTGWVGK